MAEIPRTIAGKYTVSRLIGKGGMGVVYEAFGPDGARVAVKVLAEELTRSDTQIARFEREAHTIADLSTPHVVKVIEAGRDPETRLPFIAMEYLEGEDLRAILRRVEKLPPPVAVRIALQACEALKQAHAARVLHRDIKPANLFLALAGPNRLVKLLDFGIAKSTEHAHRGSEAESLTQTGTMMGSPQYMSPEQARGSRRLDVQADIWSLGVVLYQMLCGSTPHAALDELGAMIVLICTQPPEPIQSRAPWVSREIATIVHRALRMAEGERYPSAEAMQDALRAVLAGSPDIGESSLRSPSLEETARVAERLPPEQIQDSALPVAIDGLTGSSASGSARSAVAASRRRWALRVGVGASIAIGSALLLSASLSPTARPDAGAGAGSSQRDPTEIIVLVAISPPDAEVRVDGAPVAVREGFVEIAGRDGSTHAVRVAKDGASIEGTVAITDRRPMPARIELPGSAVPAQGSTVSSEPRAEPTGSTSSRPAQRPQPSTSGPAGSGTSTVPLLRPTR